MSAGYDPNPATVWQNTSYAPNHCDGGAAGVNIFREDSPEPGEGCWTENSGQSPNTFPAYIPAVQFKN